MQTDASTNHLPPPVAELPPEQQTEPWRLTPEQVVERFRTSLTQGLDPAEAERRLAQDGPNELARPPAVPAWRKLLGQFNELVIWILLVAAIVSGAMGEWLDTIAILVIVAANGLIGFYQERKAERAVVALGNLAAPLAKVLRGGVVQQVAARSLVVGDCLELEAGDRIPADARLLQAFAVRTQESALTGESVPVEKVAEPIASPATPLAERRNMLYMGTSFAAGKATAIVTATGMQTELGRIADLLSGTEFEPTPLQRRLKELGKVLVAACLAIVAVIFAMELARGGELFEVALIAISLAVAAVPEGLPAVVTLVLALGLERMVKRQALVRKLPSVETLGCVTIICSDKTGTLTRNEMTVRIVVVSDGIYRVTGLGYSPAGRFVLSDSIDEALAPQPVEATNIESTAPAASLPPELHRLLEIGVYCNHAQVVPADSANAWQVLGDPTEGALLVLGSKANCSKDTGAQTVGEIPFDSQRKAMSVVITDGRGDRVLYCKGAPEAVLDKCDRELRGGQAVPLDARRRQVLAELQAAMSERAYRVLGFAFREQPEMDGGEFSETGLIFAGLVGMTDPPREEVKLAIARCRDAGIKPVMITGDHPLTARAIATDLGLAGAADQVLTGAEIDRLSPDAFSQAVPLVSVYARVLAEHKLKIVRAWQARGETVAMTGDGVNDAPAVKAADIGIAMGLSGTDVTKEAADIVLMDDNFTSIVNAVEEGRGIYDNIQKFVHYLLACNAGEVLVMFFAAIIGWPSPVTAIQILWINLVTDGLPALALGLEPPEPDIMWRQPRPLRQRLITRGLGLRIVAHGLLIALVSLLAFGIAYAGDESRLAAGRTAAFCVMACSQLFFSFACRSQRYTLPELGVASNRYLFLAIAASLALQIGAVAWPALESVFDVTGPSLSQWGLILVLSAIPVTIVEVLKLLRAAWRRRAQRSSEVEN